MVKYKQKNGELDRLMKYIQASVNNPDERNCRVVLAGPSGTGKSFIVDKIQEMLDCPMNEAIGQTGLTRVDLEGYRDFNEHGTFWVDGIIPHAIKSANKNGIHILKLEEYNLMPPEVQPCINSVLDNQAKISLISNAGQIVKVDRGCTLIVIITINEGYLGTFDMQESLNSRTEYKDYFEYGTIAQEAEIIQLNTGAPKGVAKAICKFGKELRRAAREADRSVDSEITTRGLISCAKLAQSGLNGEEAIKCSIAHKIAQDPEQHKLILKMADGQGLISTLNNYAKKCENGEKTELPDDTTEESMEEGEIDAYDFYDAESGLFNVKAMNDNNVAFPVKNNRNYYVNSKPEFIIYEGKKWDIADKGKKYPEGKSMRILGSEQKLYTIIKEDDNRKYRETGIRFKSDKPLFD
jgi:hypothetical protein